MPKVNFTTPVGRLVRGSLYQPKTTDAEGKPLLVKFGPNAGQARVDYYFEVAIPKQPGHTHWAQTEWGQKIYQAGVAGFPQGQANHPTFAWKVVDGDSQVPNRNGKKPCERVGYPGNWVIRFSSGFPPKCYNGDGSQQLVEKDAIKLGYYVQVNGDVDANGSMQQPGVYISHNMVALAGYGEEIIVGPDPTAAGFGQGVQLPPGASVTPVGGFAPVAPGAPAAYGAPAGAVPLPHVVPAFAQPGMQPAAPYPAGGAMPANPSSPPLAPPNPAFLGVAPPPAAPAAPPARQMTAKANGATYDQLIAAGWNDALLVQHGMMTA